MTWEAYKPTRITKRQVAGEARLNKAGQLKLHHDDLVQAGIHGREVVVELDRAECRIGLRDPTGWHGPTMTLTPSNKGGGGFFNASRVLLELGVDLELASGSRPVMVHDGRLIVLLPKPPATPRKATPIKAGGGR